MFGDYVSCYASNLKKPGKVQFTNETGMQIYLAVTSLDTGELKVSTWPNWTTPTQAC